MSTGDTKSTFDPAVADVLARGQASLSNLQSVYLNLPKKLTDTKDTKVATDELALVLSRFKSEMNRELDRQLGERIRHDSDTLFEMLKGLERYTSWMADAMTRPTNPLVLPWSIVQAFIELYNEMAAQVGQTVGCPMEVDYSQESQLALQDSNENSPQAKIVYHFTKHTLRPSQFPNLPDPVMTLYGPEGTGKTLIARDSAHLIAEKLYYDAIRRNMKMKNATAATTTTVKKSQIEEQIRTERGTLQDKEDKARIARSVLKDVENQTRFFGIRGPDPKTLEKAQTDEKNASEAFKLSAENLNRLENELKALQLPSANTTYKPGEAESETNFQFRPKDFVRLYVADVASLRKSGSVTVGQIVQTIKRWYQCAYFASHADDLRFAALGKTRIRPVVLLVLDNFSTLYESREEVQNFNPESDSMLLKSNTKLLLDPSTRFDKNTNVTALDQALGEEEETAPPPPPPPPPSAGGVGGVVSRTGGTTEAERLAYEKLTKQLAEFFDRDTLTQMSQGRIYTLVNMRYPWKVPELLQKQITTSHVFVDLPSDALRKNMIQKIWDNQWLDEWSERLFNMYQFFLRYPTKTKDPNDDKKEVINRIGVDQQVNWLKKHGIYGIRKHVNFDDLIKNAMLVSKGNRNVTFSYSEVLEYGEKAGWDKLNASLLWALGVYALSQDATLKSFGDVTYQRARLRTVLSDAVFEQEYGAPALYKLSLAPAENSGDTYFYLWPYVLRAIYDHDRESVFGEDDKLLNQLVHWTGFGLEGYCLAQQSGIPSEHLKIYFANTGRSEKRVEGKFPFGLNAQQINVLFGHVMEHHRYNYMMSNVEQEDVKDSAGKVMKPRHHRFIPGDPTFTSPQCITSAESYARQLLALDTTATFSASSLAPARPEFKRADLDFNCEGPWIPDDTDFLETHSNFQWNESDIEYAFDKMQTDFVPNFDYIKFIRYQLYSTPYGKDGSYVTPKEAVSCKTQFRTAVSFPDAKRNAQRLYPTLPSAATTSQSPMGLATSSSSSSFATLESEAKTKMAEKKSAEVGRSVASLQAQYAAAQAKSAKLAQSASRALNFQRQVGSTGSGSQSLITSLGGGRRTTSRSSSSSVRARRPPLASRSSQKTLF